MPKDFKKILIIHPGGIGDMVMVTPAFQILEKLFPKAKIDIFAGYTFGAADVLKESKSINKIFDAKFKNRNIFNKIKFIYSLRKEKYDLVIVTTGVNPLMGSLLTLIIGAKNRVGEYDNSKLNFYTHKVKLDGTKHKIESNLNLLRALGIKIVSPIPPVLFLTSANDRDSAKEFIMRNNLEDKLLIGFFPGSGPQQQFKRWDKNNFIELGKKIIKNFPNAFILIFTTKEEKNISSKIQQSLKEKSMEIIGFPLKTVAALIADCKIFVTSDTGLGHITATTGTNLIGIFGPTIPERSGPLGQRVHIIKEKCDYQYHDIFTPKYDTIRDHRCLKKISADRVFNEVKKILQK